MKSVLPFFFSLCSLTCAMSAEEKLTEEKPAEEKPTEVKPTEEKPAEEKPTEVKPAEEKPTEERLAAENPAPATPEHTPAPTPKPVSVCDGVEDLYDAEKAKLYMRYAAAASCTESSVKSWDCGPICEGEPGFTNITALGDYLVLEGYVVKLNHPKQDADCLISFAGSSNALSWIQDELMWNTEWPTWSNSTICPNCTVHRGYASAYSEIRGYLSKAIEDYKCDSVVITGQGSGGAMATLAALDVRRSLKKKVNAVWTFGAPRVGDDTFALNFIKAAEEQQVKPPSWRVVHNYDPLARLGPSGWFVHEPCEVFYEDDASNKLKFCKSMLNVDDPDQTILEDPDCSYATSFFGCLGGHDDQNTYMNVSTADDKLSDKCTSASWGFQLAVVINIVFFYLLYKLLRKGREYFCTKRERDPNDLDSYILIDRPQARR